MLQYIQQRIVDLVKDFTNLLQALAEISDFRRAFCYPWQHLEEWTMNDERYHDRTEYLASKRDKLWHSIALGRYLVVGSVTTESSIARKWALEFSSIRQTSTSRVCESATVTRVITPSARWLTQSPSDDTTRRLVLGFKPSLHVARVAILFRPRGCLCLE